MSLIPCSTNCIYQDDGICRLERISSSSSLANPKHNVIGGCPYFVEMSGKRGLKSIIDSPRSNDVDFFGNYQL